MDAVIWPATGSLVEVQVRATRERMRAVVDDVRPPHQLHLREPVTLTGGPVEAVPLGSSLLLSWMTLAGPHEMSVLLDERPALRVPVWRLTPVPAPAPPQRRTLVRAPAFVRVELLRGTQQWNAGLADISGGGARCIVGHTEDLAVGDALQLRFALEDEMLRLPVELLALELMGRRRASLRLRFTTQDRAVALLQEMVTDHHRRGLAVGRQ